MQTAKQDSRFAWQALCLFFVWGVWIILLNIAEDAGYISNMAEAFFQLIPFLAGFAMMVWYSRRSRLSTAIKVTFLVMSFCICALSFFNLTEFIGVLDEVAVVGKNSSIRPVFENMIKGTWLASGFFLIYLMVRALQKISQKLEIALVELEAAQKQNIQRERLAALGEMASGIAHDLNNTLAPVITYSELLLKDSNLTDQQRQNCLCALQSATDAASVIKRLGIFYRGGVNSSADSEVDMKSLLAQIPLLTRPKWRDEAQLQGREIDLKLELDDVPPVWGNASELRTVLANLVFNAVDAMPQGGVITLRLFTQGDREIIEVGDTGTGMTPEQSARCFDPFYSTKVEKSGLGLSVCHGIVRQHGGTIEIDTSPRQGTVIRIRLPIMLTGAGDAAEKTATEIENFTLRCLYIEDDVFVRDAFAMMLHAYGGEVDLAENGLQGLELIESREYDLVFTDLGMSDMDGAQVLQSIKSKHPQLPVIVISGWPRNEVLAKFSGKLQPDDVLEKPVSLSDILRVLTAFSPARSG